MAQCATGLLGRCWKPAGLALVALHALLLGLSSRFSHRVAATERPIVGLVVLGLAAGALYCVVVVALRHRRRGSANLLFIASVGIALRLLLLSSQPILETDYYRYLWDGAVVVNGFNPYAHAPAAVLGSAPSSDAVPDRLVRLAMASGSEIAGVNHPHLRSVYPPVAQAAFALAYGIRPWSLAAWRAVLAVADVGTVLLLCRLLRRMRIPLGFLAIYWWNPILVKETYNSGHVDVVALPFVVGAVLAAIEKRPTWTAVLVGLGMGVKLWPVVLLPVLLRTSTRTLLQGAMPLGIFTILSAALAAPVLLAGPGSDSGLVAYGRSWEMNDALFMVVAGLTKLVLSLFRVDSDHHALAARGLVACLVGGWALWSARRRPTTPADLCGRCLSILAVMFLLSPTQFPWYAIWMMPFLATSPRLSLLLMTALLPLYYLRFDLSGRGLEHVFDHWVVWIEYLPVLIALFLEWTRCRHSRTIASSAGAAG